MSKFQSAQLDDVSGLHLHLEHLANGSINGGSVYSSNVFILFLATYPSLFIYLFIYLFKLHSENIKTAQNNDLSDHMKANYRTRAVLLIVY